MWEEGGERACTPELHPNIAAFCGHWGFLSIDLNLIMILLVLVNLGAFRGLVTQKTDRGAKRNLMTESEWIVFCVILEWSIGL